MTTTPQHMNHWFSKGCSAKIALPLFLVLICILAACSSINIVQVRVLGTDTDMDIIIHTARSIGIGDTIVLRKTCISPSPFEVCGDWRYDHSPKFFMDTTVVVRDSGRKTVVDRYRLARVLGVP